MDENKKSTKKHPIVHSEKTRKALKIITVLMIAFLVVNAIISVIEPVIDMQCMNMAKSIATKVSNEQATVVMADYEYAQKMNKEI